MEGDFHPDSQLVSLLSKKSVSTLFAILSPPFRTVAASANLAKRLVAQCCAAFGVLEEPNLIHVFG